MVLLVLTKNWIDCVTPTVRDGGDNREMAGLPQSRMFRS